MKPPLRLAGVLGLLFVSTGIAIADPQPVSRPLTLAPGSASVLKVAREKPAPVHFELIAELKRDGRMSIQCSATENPAYRAWRERVGRETNQAR